MFSKAVLSLGALLLLAAPAAAQFAPALVNVTSGDAFLNVEWAITAAGGDPTIRTFTGEFDLFFVFSKK